MARPATSPETLLRHHDLRVTDCRSQVLATFFARDHALSHAELETLLTDYDRVTLYRTLTTFTDKGLIHRVLDDSGAMKYALCAEACAEHHHHDDNHVHFKCTKCGKTECLDDIKIPPFNIPAGYRSQAVNVLVQGLCKSC